MYYPYSENKGADQLRGYREADLRLCFRICKNPVFSGRGSNTDFKLTSVLAYLLMNEGQLSNIEFKIILMFSGFGHFENFKALYAIPEEVYQYNTMPIFSMKYNLYIHLRPIHDLEPELKLCFPQDVVHSAKSL